MFEISVHPVPDAVRQRAYLNDDDYQRLYRQSVENPDEFWGEQAKAFLDWFKPWHSVHHGDLRKGQATWFKGGQLNVAYNCIDRHLERRGEQIAIVWEGDNPSESAHITYRKLHHNVCRLANVLKSRGVEKGDRVCIYMPMIPEAPTPCSPAPVSGRCTRWCSAASRRTRCATASSMPTAAL